MRRLSDGSSRQPSAAIDAEFTVVNPTSVRWWFSTITKAALAVAVLVVGLLIGFEYFVNQDAVRTASAQAQTPPPIPQPAPAQLPQAADQVQPQQPAAVAPAPPATSVQTTPAFPACVPPQGEQSPEALRARASDCEAERAEARRQADIAARRSLAVTPLPERSIVVDGNGRRWLVMPDGTRVIDPDCVRCVEPVAPPRRPTARPAPPPQTCAPSTFTIHFWDLPDIRRWDSGRAASVEEVASRETRQPGTPSVPRIHGVALWQAAQARRLSRASRGEATIFGETRQAVNGMIQIELTREQRGRHLEIPVGGGPILSPRGGGSISYFPSDWGNEPLCGGRMNTHVVFR